MGVMMRSNVLRALALAVLVLPSIGEAAPGPFQWKEAYVALAGANLVEVEGDTTFSLGFDFQLYGQTFNEVRVGKKGYVTLGYAGATPIAAANPEALPAALNSSNQPGNLIAAWWGDHHCDNDDSSIRVQTVGTAPNREFRVEWDCYAKTQSGQQSDVKFTAQVRIFENSSVVQLRYGKLTIKEGDNSDWQSVRAGIKNQNGSQFSNAIPECAGGSCKRANFPNDSVIQYGVWLDNPTWPNNAADVIARLDAASISHGVDSSGGQDKVWVTVEGQLLNISEIRTSEPVVYRVYLSPTMGDYVSEANTPTLKKSGDDTKGEGEVLQGHPDPFHVLDITTDDPSTPAIETRLEKDRDLLPSYALHLCVSAIVGAFNGAREQAPHGKDNNWYCDPRLLFFGPDLKGGISAYPAQAKPMDVFNVNVTVRNEGNMVADPAKDPIKVRVYLVDVEDPTNRILMASPNGKKIMHPSAGDYDAAVGFITEPIAPGEMKSATLTVMVPFAGQLNKSEWYVAVEVDHAGNANPVKPFTIGSQKIRILLPFYTLPSETFELEMPMGCVLGEPFRARVEFCNNGGDGEAFNFRPEIAYANDGAGPNDPDSGFGASLIPSCINTRKGPTGVWEEFDDPALCQDGEVCAFGGCWQLCDPEDSKPNNGCPEGFRCLRNAFLMAAEVENEYACGPFLAVGECREYVFVGEVPKTERGLSRNPTGDRDRDDLPDLAPLMPTFVPNAATAPALNEDYWPLEVEVTSYECQWPRPNISADNMSIPLPVLEVYAGNPFNVERRFSNRGTLPTTFEYGYYISNVPELSALQMPVPVLGSSDDLGRSWIERRAVDLTDPAWPASDGIDQRYDTVVVPSGTTPGDYYFGVVVDPNNKLSELSKADNIYVYPYLLRVLEPTVHIETRSLPTGTVGVRYNHSLWASGGMGGHHWEKVAGFPAWLDLNPETGHLSGIPEEERDYVLTVRVRSGAIWDTRTYSLRILAPEGRLSIPPHVLPPAITGLPYGPVELKANGGKPPYTWSALPIGGTGMALPPGFCLTPGGVIVTTQHCPPTEPFNLVPVPSVVDAGAYRFLAVVTDSRGATAIQELTLHVTGSKALRISTNTISAGTVGESYFTSCILAEGPANATYEWTVTGLPKGLGTINQNNGVCIVGIPEEFGVFMVTATASYQGMQASKTFTLEIANKDLVLVRSHLGTFAQGASVDEKVEASEEVTLTILQGRLPSGLALEGDRVRGVISPTAEPGNYSLLLELRTPTGRISPAGLGITVAKAESAKEKGDEAADEGCGSSATGSSPASGMGFAVAMLGLLGTLFSRRKRSTESN